MSEAIQHQTEHGFSYVRISELPEHERARFSAWMAGQTRPIIPGLEPQDAVYVWDYNNWRNEVYNGRPSLWD